MLNINTKSEIAFKGFSTIHFNELSQSLIKLIDITETSLSEEMVIVGLNFFRRVIELENQEIAKCIADWCVDDFKDKIKEIERRQIQLVKTTGIVPMLCGIISSSKSKSVI